LKKIFLFYSFLLLLFILSLDSSLLSDRDAYAANVNNSIVVLLDKVSNFDILFFLKEPLYDVFALILFLLFDDGYVALPYFIIFSFSLFVFSLYRSLPFNFGFEGLIFVLIILFLPLVLKNYIIHLRQGLAMSLFYFLYSSNFKHRKILLFLPAFIHGTFLFISPIIVFFEIFSKFRMYFYFLTPLFLFVLIPFFSSMFIGLNPKIDSIEDYDNTVSGFGFIFFFLIFFLLLFRHPSKYLNYISLFFIYFYLMSYFVQASFSARIFESSLPLCFFDFRDSTFQRRTISLLFILYIIIQLIRNPSFIF
jgi:hypothetical protein